MARKINPRGRQEGSGAMASPPDPACDWRPAGDPDGSGERRCLESLSEAPEAIFLLDDQGCIRFWSRGAELLFGYNRDAMDGRPATCLLAGVIPDAMRPGASRSEAGGAGEGPSAAVSLGLRKDGATFPARFTLGGRGSAPGRLRFVLARDITEEKRAEQAARASEDLHRDTRSRLEYRLRFENLVTSFSTHFINLPSDRIEKGIRYALRALGEFAGADRCSIFQFSADRTEVGHTHEWRAPGVEALIDRLEARPVSRYPWFMERIEGLKTVQVPKVSDLPAQAAAEKAELAAQGIRGLIAVPMVHRGVPKGYLRLDAVREERRWSDETLSLLRIVGEIFVNVLDRKQVDEALREAKARYMNIFENAVEGIYQTTTRGAFISANPSLARILGFADPRELTQAGDLADTLYVDAGRRREFLRILEERGRVVEFDSQVRRRDGTLIWVTENARAVRGTDGCIECFEGTVFDITERRHMEERLARGALYDSLTGLPNRTLATEFLGRALERARRKCGSVFAAMVLDLDRFKMVNDSMGHAQGDRLLVAFSRRMAAFLPPATTLARLGGDEFLVLTDEIRDPGPATSLADRIQEALSLPFDLEGREVYAAASIGIVLGSGQYAGAEDVLRDADIAMHRAKQGGKGRYELFDSSMHAKAVHLLNLETDLRKAIERNEFRLHYQPIVSLKDGALTGFEALIRWHHPRLGMVPPLDFIPLAEDTGLIVPIGAWVLKEACRQLAEWRGHLPGGRTLTMSINISGKQLDTMDLAGQVEAVLKETGIDPSSLHLEVTESAIMENPEMAAAILERLKRLGPRLSLDDFGTGYSSLSYLHRLPFHILKIDRSFITKLEGGDKDAEIVRVINALARNLGMDVVAEGIETEGQLELLRKLDCGFGQGYFFSRPLEHEAAGRLLETGIPARPRPPAAGSTGA